MKIGMRRKKMSETGIHSILKPEQTQQETVYQFIPLTEAIGLLHRTYLHKAEGVLIYQLSQVLTRAIKLHTELDMASVGDFLLYRSSNLMFRQFSVGQVIRLLDGEVELHMYAAKTSRQQSGPKMIGFRQLLSSFYQPIYLSSNDRRLFLASPTLESQIVRIQVKTADILTGPFKLDKNQRLPKTITRGIQKNLLIRLSHFRESLLRTNQMM